MRPQKSWKSSNKIPATAQSLFVTASSYCSCAHSLGAQRITLATAQGAKSHEQPRTLPLGSFHLTPLGWLISLHTAISYIFLWRLQEPQLTSQQLSLDNLRKLEKLPAGSWHLQFLLCFVPIFESPSPHCAAAQARTRPTASHRNCATTPIRPLCRDLAFHPHVSKYISLNMPSGEDQLAPQWTSLSHFPS